jgi:exosortase/archaeosortase family protein
LASRAVVGLELPARRAAGVRRRELFLWIVICLFANQALQLIDTSSLKALTDSLASQNYFLWLAAYAVIFRLLRSDADVPASRRDCGAALVFCGALLCASFLPYRFGTGLLTTATAGYILLQHEGDRNVRAAGVVLLALAVQLVWAPIVFQLFTPELLRADAALVGELLAWLRPDVAWRGTNFTSPDGHTVTLVGACSSFNNVSSALLACVAVAMLTRTEWRRRDLATIAVASVVMILANSLRLCLVTGSAAEHLYWHNGIGEQILTISQTFVILLIAWWGAAPRKSEA